MAASQFPIANGSIESAEAEFSKKKETNQQPQIKQKFDSGAKLPTVLPGPFVQVDRIGDWPGYPEPT